MAWAVNQMPVGRSPVSHGAIRHNVIIEYITNKDKACIRQRTYHRHAMSCCNGRKMDPSCLFYKETPITHHILYITMLLLTELYDVVLCSTHFAHDVFIGVRLDYKEAATVCKVSLKCVCHGRVMEVSLVFILQKILITYHALNIPMLLLIELCDVVHTTPRMIYLLMFDWITKRPLEYVRSPSNIQICLTRMVRGPRFTNMD